MLQHMEAVEMIRPVPVLAAIALTLCSACTASGSQKDSVPPPDWTLSRTWSATLATPPAGQLTLGSLRISFGQTTLKQVKHTLGTGRIAHQGDAGNSLAWLCYTVPDNSHPARLWLVSSELDAGKYITGAIIKQARPKRDGAAAACPVLPKTYRDARLGKFLWLGTAAQTLGHRLGPPSHQIGGWRMFDYGKTFKTPNCQRAEDNNSLRVLLQDGRVIAMQAYRTVAC